MLLYPSIARAYYSGISQNPNVSGGTMKKELMRKLVLNGNYYSVIIIAMLRRAYDALS